MEINYQFRKNRFIFHFFLKIKPTILSSGRLIVIKNLLLLPVEQIFRLVQIFFRNHVVIFPKLLPLKATFPSSKNIIFNYSLFPASGNLFSVQWKQYLFVQSFFSAVRNQQGEPILENIFLVLETILFDFLARRSRIYRQW